MYLQSLTEDLNIFLRAVYLPVTFLICFILGLYTSSTNDKTELKMPSVKSPKILNVVTSESRITRNALLYDKWKNIKTKAVEDIYDLAFTDNGHGWFTDSSSKIYRTSDGGNSWKMISPLPGKNVSVGSLHFINSNTGWKAEYVQKGPHNYQSDVQTTVLKTMDGGLSWIPQYFANGVSLSKISFVNENEGWAVGSKCKIVDIETWEPFLLHTSDGGKTWLDLSQNLIGLAQIRNSYVQDIGVISPQAAIIITSDRKLFATEDKGNNWEEIGQFEFGNKLGSFVKAPAGDYALMAGVGGRHCCYSTFYSGKNNSLVRNEIPTVYVTHSIYTRDGLLFAAGTIAVEDNQEEVGFREVGVIMISRDNGRRWEIVYEAKKVERINALAIAEESIWAVGDNGLILKALLRDFSN